MNLTSDPYKVFANPEDKLVVIMWPAVDEIAIMPYNVRLWNKLRENSVS